MTINENDQRAYRAQDAIDLYHTRRGYQSSLGEAVCDLIADLLHLAGQNDLIVERVHNSAMQHYLDEIETPYGDALCRNGLPIADCNCC
jgi:hypothetical protein